MNIRYLLLLTLPLLAFVCTRKEAALRDAPEVKVTNRAPASVVAAHPLAAHVASRIPEVSKLEDLQSCYERECPFPAADSRGYYFAVGQALKSELLSLAEEARAGKPLDPQVVAAARSQLDTEDGHVQAAALRVLATQAPAPESRDAILQFVIGGYDAEVIPDALAQLARYTSPEDQAQIAPALANAMATGSPFVAKAVAAGVAPFVSEETAGAYREALTAIPEGSVVKEQLQAALEK
jgi:hypothetical protein